MKTWATRLLLAFVFITLGFAWGKQSARKEMTSGTAGKTAPLVTGEKLLVYSAHMTFRCHECTEIERLTRVLIEEQFADLLAEGRITFQSIDYQKHPEFARKHEVFSSTVVLVEYRDGVEVGFDRLDDVWTLSRDVEKFNAYVEEALRARLSSGGSGS
ncbi:MAG TPA: nitrophenyl compound nitroreductase subunit ArsF family protein [Kiritimatiellia bacterium]|nr:nitrophenyl compound nitroreductase subunit ArsF family protein [Kiritimatiellia bacterium]HMO98540.1 nitrophenyl compound nitroreductase subunit ArsF family protein [Kiritimatiellia bacterium]HMP96974.1 nitrophenyl compound nitroreductase subunit ArsF family protein [Kiritimatiellia bacterium]